MVGEYMTNCCLYSAHKLCQITWYSGLLAQLEQHIIVGICCLSHQLRSQPSSPSETLTEPWPRGLTKLKDWDYLWVQHIQWLTKLSQCLVLLDYSLNSFECKTYINKVLLYQKESDQGYATIKKLCNSDQGWWRYGQFKSGAHWLSFVRGYQRNSKLQF